MVWLQMYRRALELLLDIGWSQFYQLRVLECGRLDWHYYVVFSAKEVVVSSFSVLFSINNINSAAGMAALSGILGASGFTSLNAYALMIFCLLYTPCIATIATIKRETRSWKWTIGMVVFQLILAWVAATLVFQIGRLL